MDDWMITGVDPDLLPDDAGRGVIATLHCTRGEALAAGCEAVAAGYLAVEVRGTFGPAYSLKDVA